ncbi:MAG TPA: hypothetical protein VHD76_07540 [Bryobacteraceae bacterium]|jgi:hypothetical protein|nr:hypothetical protein [Bryobacteraceae bacterium]
MKTRLALLGCLLAVAAWAADVSGKWTAQMPGRGGDTREVTFDLKADGAALTGTVSNPRGGATDISDGKVDGETVSFSVVREFNGNQIKMNYTGKVEGDEIHFKVEREGGQGRSREFTAKRAAN